MYLCAGRLDARGWPEPGAATVAGQVGEAVASAANASAPAFGDHYRLASPNRTTQAVDFQYPFSGYRDDQHVDLMVHMLTDAFVPAKHQQIGVEV